MGILWNVDVVFYYVSYTWFMNFMKITWKHLSNKCPFFHVFAWSSHLVFYCSNVRTMLCLCDEWMLKDCIIPLESRIRLVMISWCSQVITTILLMDHSNTSYRWLNICSAKYCTDMFSFVLLIYLHLFYQISY